MRKFLTTATSVIALSIPLGAIAAISPDEAKQLGTSLTAFGAEKAGNADGSIPAYTGGITAMTNLPTPIANGTGFNYPDPFASEKPVVSITKENVEKYGDLMTPGAKTLVERLPGYRIDLYPTHRTASWPDWVLQNNIKNATAANLMGDVEGDGVKGAYAGLPFPIPKNGYEVMWDYTLRWQPPYNQDHFHNAMVDSSGAVTDLGEIDTVWLNMFYDKAKTGLSGEFANEYYVSQLSPEAAAGDLYLFEYPINYSSRDQTTWFYSPGLRRVRMAPEFTYDTPIASYGGALSYDEIILFSGRLDKFQLKLVGKKELIVPYNCYRMDTVTLDQSKLVGPRFLNPDFVRWEKHRVWVVDATLKPGERHVDSRKTFYFDEDSWKLIAEESYDQSGAFYRIMFQYPFTTYGDPDTSFVTEVYGAYDLSKGNYFISHLHTGPKDHTTENKDLPSLAKFTPEAMTGHGVR